VAGRGTAYPGMDTVGIMGTNTTTPGTTDTVADTDIMAVDIFPGGSGWFLQFLFLTRITDMDMATAWGMGTDSLGVCNALTPKGLRSQ
jgi:hypothetical protein